VFGSLNYKSSFDIP